MRNDDLAVDRAASFLRTRPPVGEEGEEVGCADVAEAGLVDLPLTVLRHTDEVGREDRVMDARRARRLRMPLQVSAFNDSANHLLAQASAPHQAA